jgi:hypothetical protein
MHACMHTYICVYIYIYMHIYIHVYVHEYIHTHTHTYIHTYTHTNKHTYIHTYTQTHTHTHTQAHTHTHTHRHIHTHTHTQAHTHTHTGTYTHTQAHVPTSTYSYTHIHRMQTFVYTRASFSKKTRLGVFENIMIRKKLGPQRREVTRTEGSNKDWRKLYSETLINLYSSQNIIDMIIQKNEIDGSRCTYGREQKCILYLVKKPEEKRQLGRNCRKQGDITTVDLT